MRGLSNIRLGITPLLVMRIWQGISERRHSSNVKSQLAMSSLPNLCPEVVCHHIPHNPWRKALMALMAIHTLTSLPVYVTLKILFIALELTNKGFKPQQQQTNFVPNTQDFDPNIMHPPASLPALSTPSFLDPGLLVHDPFVSPRALAHSQTLVTSAQGRSEMSRVSAPAQHVQEGAYSPGLSRSQRSQPNPRIKQEPEDDFAPDPILAAQLRRNPWKDFMRIAPEARMIAAPNSGSMNQPTSSLAGSATQSRQGPALPPPTQGPPLDLTHRRFQDSAAARQYLNQVHWRPITKSHGVPQTEDERLPYVRKIYNGFIDISKVHDGDYFAQDKHRFDARSGVWGADPASIEAIANEVVNTCIHIHNHGVTGLPLRRSTGLQLPDNHLDRSWTFAQRIHMMSSLIARFKFCANHVMQSFFTMQYLARPWSTLMDQPHFVQLWKASSPESQNAFYYIQPYENVPAEHPKPNEVAQFRREWQQEVQQRNQRIVLARQQQRNLQSSSSLANSSPAMMATTRAQQKVLEHEAKRRKLNDSSAQAAPQPRATESSPHEQVSGSRAAETDEAHPAQETETDWERFFREHDGEHGDIDLNVDDIEALFATRNDGDGSSATGHDQGEDVVERGNKGQEHVDGAAQEGKASGGEYDGNTGQGEEDKDEDTDDVECTGGAGEEKKT